MVFVKSKNIFSHFVLLCAVFLAVFFWIFNTPVFAQEGAGAIGSETSEETQKQLQSAGGAAKYALKNPGLVQTAVVLIRLVLSMVGVVFFAMLVYGGYRWMTAGGNEDSMTEAKGTIKNAVIGMAVVFASYAITIAVVRIFLPAATSEGGSFFGVQIGPSASPSPESSSGGLQIFK